MFPPLATIAPSWLLLMWLAFFRLLSNKNIFSDADKYKAVGVITSLWTADRPPLVDLGFVKTVTGVPASTFSAFIPASFLR
jgi:hypothetical protein